MKKVVVLNGSPRKNFNTANTFFQDIWSEIEFVIARAIARSNPAFANLKR